MMNKSKSILSRRAISVPLLSIITALTILGALTYGYSITREKEWFARLETIGHTYSRLIIRITDVTLEGKPIEDTSNLILIIHNFTDLPSTPIYQGKFKPRLEFPIFVRLLRLRRGESLIPIITPPHCYVITLIYYDGMKVYDGVSMLDILPNKPIIEKQVKIDLKEVPKPKVSASSHTPSFGLGLTHALNFKQGSGVREEWDYEYAWTSVLELHSVEGSKVYAKFNEGSLLYLQLQRRRWYNSPTPPEDLKWDDIGAKSTKVTITRTTGYAMDGAHYTVQVYVRYYYERWKYYIDPTAGIIMYEEWIIPEVADLSKGFKYITGTKTCHCGSVSGNVIRIGSIVGESVYFTIAGTKGYYWTPGAKVFFTISYPGIPFFTLGAEIYVERRYSQGIQIIVEVTENRYSESLYGYDAGTNWATVYLAWVFD